MHDSVDGDADEHPFTFTASVVLVGAAGVSLRECFEVVGGALGGGGDDVTVEEPVAVESVVAQTLIATRGCVRCSRVCGGL